MLIVEEIEIVCTSIDNKIKVSWMNKNSYKMWFL